MKPTTITGTKNILLPAILLFSLVLALSLNTFASKQDRQVKDFNRIEISSAFNVTLTQGTTEKLTIEADDDMLSKIITEVRGGTLMIRLENNSHINNSSKLNAELTFINLDGIEISGAVKLNGTNAMKFTHLEIECSGASDINLDLSASMLDMDLSGASKMTLKGNSPELKADLSGACNLDAENLKTQICNLECSGASKVRVFATGKLNVEGSGATHVSYAGNPASIESDMTGASKLSKL